MSDLTHEGREIVAGLAQKYYLSADAVTSLLYSVAAGGGNQAQFNHPEFGGMGQWQFGGMIMIGDMFNNGLKAKVASLCEELSGILRNQSLFAPAPAPQQDGASLFVPGGGWQSSWPAELGSPSSSGSQNDLSYAFFPSTRRLAIRQGGELSIYDTGDHNIGGVSQQQGGGQSVTFTSQYGLVRLSDLPLVSPAPAQQAAQTPAFQQAQPVQSPPAYVEPQASQPSFSQPSSSDQSGDVFAAIERLADLHAKKILSDDEFSAKKAELLSRL